MTTSKYASLSHTELIRLLEARDRQTKFGLHWEANEIERDNALNSDFVALYFDASLSAGNAPYQNLIIEGDNFDALRHLKMCYSGQVKCIYIDPPYNTGNKDFVYNDRFIDANDLWRHSTWIEFMYQRLTLAKELLQQDGVIFISIDDNEQANLRLLCNKVFGESHFYTQVIIQSNIRGHTYRQIAKTHEYLLVYTKSESVEFNEIPKTEENNDLNLVDMIGNFNIRELRNRNPKFGRFNRPNLYYPFYVNPNSVDSNGHLAVSVVKSSEFFVEVFPKNSSNEDSCWRWSIGTANESISANTMKSDVVAKKVSTGGYNIYEKYRKETVKAKSIWAEPQFTTERGTLELRQFGITEFDFPKPIALIHRAIHLATGKNDIILDFFAGSGTTGHAVLKMNKEDGGNRKFILVSNTEATSENPDKNLCRDICAERIRRVINGYNGEEGLGGNFAYLRCRRVAPAELLDIDHEEVWHSLSLMHLGSLTPYRPKHGFMWAGDEISAVAYVPRYSDELLPALRAAVQTTGEATIYSWQPEMLKTRVRSPRASHQGIPDTLARRFGLGRG
ncbi:MAG: site-specific DNA-methyltransferase [Azoarcus sp.]|jgi:adenine-specific DNA-methyltransferase|nr:site-specific DNA-methyltransferase [Azoarcus sp.]